MLVHMYIYIGTCTMYIVHMYYRRSKVHMYYVRDKVHSTPSTINYGGFSLCSYSMVVRVQGEEEVHMYYVRGTSYTLVGTQE